VIAGIIIYKKAMPQGMAFLRLGTDLPDVLRILFQFLLAVALRQITPNGFLRHDIARHIPLELSLTELCALHTLQA